MKSEKELWSFSDNIMHYAEVRQASWRQGFSWNSWKLIWLALDCSLHLGNNKQSDKKWRQRTIVKTMPGPDLRLSVSPGVVTIMNDISQWFQLRSLGTHNYTTTTTSLSLNEVAHTSHTQNQNTCRVLELCVFLSKNWPRYLCPGLATWISVIVSSKRS